MSKITNTNIVYEPYDGIPDQFRGIVEDAQFTAEISFAALYDGSWVWDVVLVWGLDSSCGLPYEREAGSGTALSRAEAEFAAEAVLFGVIAESRRNDAEESRHWAEFEKAQAEKEEVQ